MTTVLDGEIYGYDARKREIAVQMGLHQKKVIRFKTGEEGWRIGEPVKVYIVRPGEVLVVEPSTLPVMVEGVTLD